jgi:hypothetical protein
VTVPRFPTTLFTITVGMAGFTGATVTAPDVRRFDGATGALGAHAQCAMPRLWRAHASAPFAPPFPPLLGYRPAMGRMRLAFFFSRTSPITCANPGRTHRVLPPR